MLTNILLVFFMVVAIAMVVLILLQQGKGADAGAAFGGGSSQSVFGARGSANFLSRATAVLAVLFFALCLTLAYLYTRRGDRDSVASSVVTAPAQPGDSAGTPPIPQDQGSAPAGAAQQGTESDVPAVPQPANE